MNCNRAEGLLSAFQDGELDPKIHSQIEEHIHDCNTCSSILDSYREGDNLLRSLPKVEPEDALRERIFSSSEFKELIENQHQELKAPVTFRKPKRIGINQKWAKTALQIAAVLTIALLGTAVFKNTFVKNTQPDTNQTPIAGQASALSSGTRVIYTSNGQLWSTLDTLSSKPQALTDSHYHVSSGWSVSPAQTSTPAGDHIAYVDESLGGLHIITSNGLKDVLITSHLAKSSTSAFWKSAEGQNILASLAWSPDGSQIAFSADPDGSGYTSLYISNADGTGLQQLISKSSTAITSPVWSPLGIRIAYVEAGNSTDAIAEYNFDSKQSAQVVAQANPSGAATDVVKNLNWSSDDLHPALNWSTASSHTDSSTTSIWAKAVGIANAQTVMLAEGNITSASYNARTLPSGAWLYSTGNGLFETYPAIADNPLTISSSSHINGASWSQDGTKVEYLDGSTLYTLSSNGLGKKQISSNVNTVPEPVFSIQNNEIAYAQNQQLNIGSLSQPHTVQSGIDSTTSNIVWSPDSKVIVVYGTSGISFVDPASGQASRIASGTSITNTSWSFVH